MYPFHCFIDFVKLKLPPDRPCHLSALAPLIVVPPLSLEGMGEEAPGGGEG